jgi:hypothetical protein
MAIDVPGALKAFNGRLKDLDNDYNNWEDHHKDLAEYLLPRKGRFLSSDTTPNDGKRRNLKIINNVAGRSITTAASGIYSTLSSPAINWFRYGLQDRELMEFNPVKEWLENARVVSNWMLKKSNFYTAAYSTYKELLAFGTAFDLADEDFDTFLRFYPFTIGQFRLAVDDTLRVNTVYRTFSMTAYQMVMKFGKDNVSDDVSTQYDKSNTESPYEVVHLIEPNDDRIDKITNKAYRSVYYEKEKSPDKFLRVSGYDDFPGMGPRWDVTGDEVYGRCPGMDVLGDVQMLQKMEDKKLRAVDKGVDPPLNAPASMKNRAVSSIPGTVNVVGANDNTDAVRPTFQVNMNVADLQASINMTKDDIREGLFVDLFRMISAMNDSPEKTAYEISKKHEEKLQQLGPVVERLQPEFLDKVINRNFEIGFKRGLFGEPPEELQGQDINIEYESILHQAQKMVGITSIEQTVGFIKSLSEVRPDALDKMDVDEMIDDYSNSVQVNPKIIHSEDEVAKKRAAQAEAMKQQQMNEALQQGVDGAKTMSETDTSGNNALTQLLGGAPE